MRKLPHYMDSGFHKAARNHGEANDRFDENYDKIDWGKTTGVIEKKEPGYVKISFGGNNGKIP